MTITPDRLTALDQITLDHGSHNTFDQGHCAMEVVAWLAGQGHTDAPSCASPVLRRFTITLNDRWDHEKRQTLKPYLPRMVGTGDDGKDKLREQIAARHVAALVGPWLRLAGLDDQAAQVEAIDGTDMAATRRVLRAARDAAWTARSKSYSELRRVVEAKVREHLAAQGKDADAAAAADADAVAAAAAAAVAAADADTVADAAAVAVAAADAAAAAAAAADTVADAAAVAVAAADAAAAAADPWGKPYSAAYKAARAYYDTHPLPISQEVADLAATQQGAALTLLDQMIDPPQVA